MSDFKVGVTGSGGLSVNIKGAEELAEALTRYVNAMNVSMPQAVRRQMKLLLTRNILPITPPNTRAQGRKRVKTDFAQAVRVLTEGGWDSKSIKSAIRKRDYQALQTIFSRIGGEVSRMYIGPFDPDWHRTARDNKGRVRGATRHATADRELAQDWLQKRQAFVGQGKGGWAAGLRVSGATPAAWFAKHADAGSASDQLAIGGYIRADNQSAWASGGEDDRRIAMAVQSRARAIVADLDLRARRAAQKAGIK